MYEFWRDTIPSMAMIKFQHWRLGEASNERDAIVSRVSHKLAQCLFHLWALLWPGKHTAWLWTSLGCFLTLACDAFHCSLFLPNSYLSCKAQLKSPFLQEVFLDFSQAQSMSVPHSFSICTLLYIISSLSPLQILPPVRLWTPLRQGPCLYLQ